MERLIVQNFLTIKHADIELQRFNILIGPQASGKSLIAKLLYFFKQEVGQALKINRLQNKDTNALNSALTAKFEEIFPRRYWANQEFQIQYKQDELSITLNAKKDEDGQADINILYTEALKEIQSSIDFTNVVNGIPQLMLFSENPTFTLAFDDLFLSESYKKHFQTQIFIPAGRSFFANLQKNIFSIISNNLDIDYFLKKFGSMYETAKIHKVRPEPDNTKDKINRILENIIIGRYLHEEGQDWIVNAEQKTNLSHASSGQQESLPMLMVLSIIPFWKKEVNLSFYIEEPEAHLFPASQKEFMSLLALIYNETSHQFFITTHSPYLLTALNNCILAHETYASASDEDKPKVLEIMPKQQHIAFSDVAAWTITEQGDLESIRDEDLKLIGADIIDEVSNHFQEVTSDLLDIRYKDSNA